MAESAAKIGAGRDFSLAVVFACVEYETWLIAGTESLAGRTFKDGRPILPPGAVFPQGARNLMAKAGWNAIASLVTVRVGTKAR